MRKAGICSSMGRQPEAGLTLCSLYSRIISSLSCTRFSAPLYFCCNFFISGPRACIAAMDFVLLTVSGVSSAMMTIVSSATSIG